MYKYVSLLLALFVLASCSMVNDETVSDANEEPFPPTPIVEEIDTQIDLRQDYVGLSETDAQRKADVEGVPFRVVERDGESLPVTMDFRPGRINATVVDDIVTSYEVEGEGMEEVE